MGIISFIQQHNRNVALKEQAEALKEQAEAAKQQAEAMHQRNSDQFFELEKENEVLKKRVAYLETFLQERLK